MSIHPVQCLASVDFKGQGIVCTFAITHLGCACGFRNGCAERRREAETYVHPIVKCTPYCHIARGVQCMGVGWGQWCSGSLVMQAQGEVCFAVVGLW